LTKPLCNVVQAADSIEFVGFTASAVRHPEFGFGEFSTEERVKAV
jgi:hypothetical protein